MLRLTIRRQDRPGDQEVREFDAAVVTIGRHPDNDLVLSEPTISRQHARIERRDGRYTVSDLKSAHGTYMNRQRVQEVRLENGAELYLNPFILAVSIEGDEAAAKARKAIQTTLPVSGGSRSTILEFNAAVSDTDTPPAGIEAAAAGEPGVLTPPGEGGGTLLEVSATPPKPVPKPAPAPAAGSGAEDGGTVFEISAAPPKAARTETPAKPADPRPSPRPAPAAPRERESRTPRTAPAPAPPAPPTPRAPRPTPRAASPPGGLVATRRDPEAARGPAEPARARGAAVPEQRLEALLAARDHGTGLWVGLDLILLLLALWPTEMAPRWVLPWQSLDGAPVAPPVAVWTTLACALLATGTALFVRWGAIRGPVLLAAGLAPLAILTLAVPSPAATDARALGDLLGADAGWRGRGADLALAFWGGPRAVLLAGAGALVLALASLRAARHRPEAALPRALAALAGLALLALLAAPVPGDGPLATWVLGAVKGEGQGAAASATLFLPALVGALALLAAAGVPARIPSRLASPLASVALFWPAIAHVVLKDPTPASLHQARNAALPGVLVLVAATGLAALLLDLLLTDDPEEQAALEAL
ncbi:MAG: FHA domain-containing protein [Planctomycetales bacterium]|nr:FHA domain-containing protein [Planctomycetales bacterium]